MFEIGDLVRYRTGGVSMTVQRVLDDRRVAVAWMASGRTDGSYETATVDAELLELAVEARPA